MWSRYIFVSYCLFSWGEFQRDLKFIGCILKVRGFEIYSRIFTGQDRKIEKKKQIHGMNIWFPFFHLKLLFFSMHFMISFEIKNWKSILLQIFRAYSRQGCLVLQQGNYMVNYGNSLPANLVYNIFVDAILKTLRFPIVHIRRKNVKKIWHWQFFPSKLVAIFPF